MATKFSAPQDKNIDDLLLDSKNPRIPVEKQSLSQDDLIVYVAQEYNAIAVARSIAFHNYFPSEPLIAIPIKGDKSLTVVEGNRRLAALKLLSYPALRDKLASRGEWDELPTTHIPKQVPVVVVKNRREVAPIIGYRHISGIQPWDAFSKARYIAAQIESGLSFKDTATEVGEKINEVRANYRNYCIAVQASKLKVDNQSINNLENNFGVFTRAMQSGQLRDFIGAPAPDKVKTTKSPIPPKKKEALKELVGFIYGPQPVIEDSRQLTALGRIVSSPEGLQVLRKERNLETADQASRDLRERLSAQLSDAARYLRAAKADMPKYKKDPAIKKLLEDCKKALAELEKI